MSLLFKLKTLSQPASAAGSCSDCWVITLTLKSSASSTISINSVWTLGLKSSPSNGESNKFLGGDGFDVWSNTGFVLTDAEPGSNQPPSGAHPSPPLIADSSRGGMQRRVGKGHIAGCLPKVPLLSLLISSWVSSP